MVGRQVLDLLVEVRILLSQPMVPSSSGQGSRVLIPKTGVRIPSGPKQGSGLSFKIEILFFEILLPSARRYLSIFSFKAGPGWWRVNGPCGKIICYLRGEFIEKGSRKREKRTMEK